MKCESCRYKVTTKDSRYIGCEECGSYQICDYCYYDFKEKYETQVKEEMARNESSDDSEFSNEEENKQSIPKEQGTPNCIYCWSKKTLTDM